MGWCWAAAIMAHGAHDHAHSQLRLPLMEAVLDTLKLNGDGLVELATQTRRRCAPGLPTSAS